MLSIDQDPILDYLATPGNFASAKEIHLAFPRLLDRLYSEFWESFHQLLQKQYENTEWRVLRPAEVLNDNHSFWVQPEESNTGLALAISGLQSKIYFGLCLDPGDKTVERSRCESYLNNCNLSFDRGSLGAWWLGRSSAYSGVTDPLIPEY